MRHPDETHAALHARACPRCALQAFPRLAPAVICLVERDDSVLLARAPQFAANTYSCLAGFVEPGETLEEAVVREVRAEVAIEVDGAEITEASWFFRERLPDLPSPMSIARLLIDDWVARSACKPGAIQPK